MFSLGYSWGKGGGHNEKKASSIHYVYTKVGITYPKSLRDLVLFREPLREHMVTQSVYKSIDN